MTDTMIHDIGHKVVGYVSLLLLVVLLGAFAPEVLAGFAVIAVATAAVLRLFRHTDADDDQATTADDVWLPLVPHQYGADE